MLGPASCSAPSADSLRGTRLLCARTGWNVHTEGAEQIALEVNFT